MSHIDTRFAELGVKRKRRFKIITPERDVLGAVLEYVVRHPLVAWARRMNTGAVKIDQRFMRFGFVGCSDIIGQLKDGRFLAIECKSSNGSLTEAQREFLNGVTKANGIAGVARSIDDAQRLLA